MRLQLTPLDGSGVVVFGSTAQSLTFRFEWLGPAGAVASESVQVRLPARVAEVPATFTAYYRLPTEPGLYTNTVTLVDDTALTARNTRPAVVGGTCPGAT
jgi:hypothetical protein